MADNTAANEVIQEIRADAVEGVASVVAVGDSIVAAEVAQVDAHLEEHSEMSEERHEEILEGQAWQENQFQLLSANQAATQAQLLALTSAQAAQQTTLSAIAETLAQMNLRLSTDSRPSNPEISEQPPEVVTPSADVAEDRPAPEPEPARRKRRVI